MAEVDTAEVETAPNRVLIIGYGNPLRGDDGVGPWIVRHSAAVPAARRIASHQLLPEMAEPVAEAGLVVFVDARADLAPGELKVEELDAASAPPPEPPFVHHLDPRALLELARAAYGRAPRAVLVGVGAASFEFGEGLSPAVERAAREAVARILALATA